MKRADFQGITQIVLHKNVNPTSYLPLETAGKNEDPDIKNVENYS
jgi:hypothetical protein